MSVSKHHFERPHNTGFDLAELLSMQEPIGVYRRGGFTIGDQRTYKCFAERQL